MPERKEVSDEYGWATELAIAVCKTIDKTFPNLNKKLYLEHLLEYLPGFHLLLEIPAQEDLSFPVSVYLQVDALCLRAGERFWVEWILWNGQEDADAFQQAVIGLLNGTNRVVEYYRGKFYLRAELQRPEEPTWKEISTSHNALVSLLFTPWWLPVNERILQNIQGSATPCRNNGTLADISHPRLLVEESAGFD